MSPGEGKRRVLIPGSEQCRMEAKCFPDILPGRELTWQVLSHLCSEAQVLVEMLPGLSRG